MLSACSFENVEEDSSQGFGFFSAAKSWQAFPANQEGNFGLWGLKNLVLVLFFMLMELKKNNAWFYVCSRGFVLSFPFLFGPFRVLSCLCGRAFGLFGTLPLEMPITNLLPDIESRSWKSPMLFCCRLNWSFLLLQLSHEDSYNSDKVSYSLSLSSSSLCVKVELGSLRVYGN